jgi:hypothetical protein
VSAERNGKADLLLEWCSVRARGSASQFDGACRHVFGEALRPSSVMGNLELLAHLEVDWNGGRRWTVTPPVLCLLPGAGGNAVCLGARTRGTRAAIEDCVRDGVLAGFTMVSQPEGWPKAWYVGVEAWPALVEAAERIGGHATAHPRQRYLAHFGDLESLLRGRVKHFSYSGFGAEALELPTLRYRPVEAERIREPGCYRQKSRGMNVYGFVDDDGAIHHLDRWTATHAELARVRARGEATPDVVAYDPDTLRLKVDARAQLPTPWARLAMASTGLAPTTVKPGSGNWYQVFEGVEANAYRDIKNSLGLPASRTHLARSAT